MTDINVTFDEPQLNVTFVEPSEINVSFTENNQEINVTFEQPNLSVTFEEPSEINVTFDYFSIPGVGLPSVANVGDIPVYNGTEWEAEALIIETDPFAKYKLSNLDLAGVTYNYFGYEDKDGNWYIKRWTLADDTFLFAKGNDNYSFADRDSLTYASIEATF